MNPLWITGGAIIVHPVKATGPREAWPIDPVQVLGAERSRRLDPLSQFALVAVRLAQSDAQWAPCDRPSLREGVVVGSALGATVTSVRYATRLVHQGPASTNPIDFPDSIDGSAAAHVALDQGLCGPSLTFTDGRESAASALTQAARMVASGRADRMIAVTGDVLDPLFEEAYAASVAAASPHLDAIAGYQCVCAWVVEKPGLRPRPTGTVELYGATAQSRWPAGGLADQATTPTGACTDLRGAKTASQASLPRPRDPSGALELAGAWLGARGPTGTWLGAWQPPSAVALTLQGGRCGYPVPSICYPHLLLVAPTAESTTR